MNNCWLVGSGVMAIDYANVLTAKGVDFLVIGRGENSASNFLKQTKKEVFLGGLNKFLDTKPAMPEYAIVAVGVEKLYEVCNRLIDYGIKKILLEKPGGINLNEIRELKNKARDQRVKIILGYNRRFYSSVFAAKKIIEEDEGVKSFTFEFTEWSHVIKGLKTPKEVKENWLFANSSHVIDMVFFMAGRPKNIYSLVKGALEWHPSAAVFCGCGETNEGALFSYHSNWAAPGRWSIEILTKNRRLFFKPLEKLSIQKVGSIQIEEFPIDNVLDTKFKPGLYLQVESFINDTNLDTLCDIEQQSNYAEVYNKIAGLN